MLLSWFHALASWQFTKFPQLRRRSRLRRRSGYGTGFGPALESLERRVLLSFSTVPTFAVGTNPAAIASADLNGDGKRDVVVANQSSNTVSVLLGNGNGTFQPKTDYATGASPRGVAVGDFNGDGRLDIAVANKGSNSISILLSNGDGTFQAKTDIPLLLTPFSLTVGDFNGDGKADLALGTGNATTADVTTMLGNGDGTFQAPVTTVTATVTPPASSTFTGGAVSIQSGDFNGDGHPDLVVLNNLDTFTSIVGRFGTQFTNFNPGSASLLLGNGDGTFQAPHVFGTGVSPTSMAVGDFNGDGRQDFAVSNLFSNSVSVFSNTNGGNFSSSTISLPNNTQSGSIAGALAAGDFNGDGVADLAVSQGSVGSPIFDSVQIYTGQTGGALQAGARYVQGLSNPIAGDFNGDGHPDLAGFAINPSTLQVAGMQVWLNSGAGAFPAPHLIAGAGVTLASQATADFNGDGIADLVTASTGQVQLGMGDGQFGDTTTLAFPSGIFSASGGNSVAAVDVDGNGTADIVVGNGVYPTGQLAAWLNSPGYDNRTGGAVSFTVSNPSQIGAGANDSVTVTAVDALGNPVPGFLGTVDLDFTPAGSTALNLAGQYTFTAADNGRHTFLFSNVTQAGAGTLSVFAVGMPTATAPLTVVPAATAKFDFTAPTAVTAGTPFSFTITAEDKFGNVETGYAGTVHFSALANDTQAVLPADYTFAAADGGTHTFTATLTRTAGATSAFIAATDVAAGATSSAKIDVTPLAPVSLSMSVASTTPTGIPLSVVVSAVDRFGNVATGYTGTVHFASSDLQAVLPADYTFTAADAGSHTFTPTLKTAGTQTLSVTNTANPAFSSQAQISAVTLVPASFEFFELPTATAGAAYSFAMVALDAEGSVVTGYTGTVHLSSSDAQAVLPADYTFTAADLGIHTFTVTLKTAGTQSLSVTDTAHPSLTNSLSVSVAPGAVDHFAISGPTSVTQGVGFKITVTAEDAFGNVVPGYRGAVHLSSTDATGGTQNFTFSNNDNGVHIFSYTFNAVGLQTLTFVDLTNSSVFGNDTVNVVPKR